MRYFSKRYADLARKEEKIDEKETNSYIVVNSHFRNYE